MTMFVRDAWYIAAWARDVPQGSTLARRILDEPIVLWRHGNGRPVAFEDRCCHRSVPLSLGQVKGATLQCGYHGLEFDETGQCVAVPGQSQVPPEARIRAYPAVERYQWIWVWMGDPALADETTIPDFRWLDLPGWVAPTGQFHLKAHYQRLVDNLLDFSHLQFVHRHTIGTDAIADAPSRIKRYNDGLEVTRWIMDSPPPPLFDKAYGGFDGNVDRWMKCRWTIPASIAIDIGCADAGSGATDGNRSRGVEIRSLHGITPETRSTTHYYWAYARNFQTENEDMTALLETGARSTFEEDVEILAWQQEMLDRTGEDNLIDITSDGPGLLARRMISEMLQRGAPVDTTEP